MNTVGKYIICVLWAGLGLLLHSHAQQPSWPVTTDAYRQTIIIGSDSTLNTSLRLETGDVLGVFYNNNQVLQCGGKLTWGNGNVLPIYNNKIIDNKTDPAGIIYFKIWKKSQNCILDSVKGTFRMLADTSVAVSTKDTLDMLYLSGKSVNAGFAYTEFCSNEGIIKPKQTSDEYSITYSSLQSPILSTTGEINLNGSFSGKMEIRFSSAYCLASKVQSLTILPVPDTVLPQEMNVCEGTPVKTAFDKYLELSTSRLDSIRINLSDKISQDLYKVELANNTRCRAKQQVKVRWMPRPPIDSMVEVKDLCDSVRINLLNTNGTVHWGATDSTENQVHFSSDKRIWVKYKNGCRNSDTLDIRIKKLKIEQLDAEEINADCFTRGRINLLKVSLSDTVGESNLQFKNLITGEEASVDGLLKEGRYRVIVTDKRKCTAQWDKELIILKDCLNDSPVFSPNNDGRDDDFYISYEGIIYIYNKNGGLIHKFQGPAYWNGTDDSGNRLPLGIYLLVTGSEAKTITILR
jgi:hypothetical protein